MAQVFMGEANKTINKSFSICAPRHISPTKSIIITQIGTEAKEGENPLYGLKYALSKGGNIIFLLRIYVRVGEYRHCC